MGAPHVIVPIVEGQSEEAAIGGFLRRIAHEAGRFDVQIARPIRVKRQQVVKSGELERRIKLAMASREGATAVLILLDADDDCPVSLAGELRDRATKVTDLRVSVVIPTFEIEAWVLAGIESVRGTCGVSKDANYEGNPESVRGAKGAVAVRMHGPHGYVETADLPALLERLDYVAASTRSPSLAKLMRDFEVLIA